MAVKKTDNFADYDYTGAIKQYGLLKITGHDVTRFLQGQFTCNLADIKPGQSQLAACCNAQGRVIGNFIIYLAMQNNTQQDNTQNTFYLSMDVSTITLLKKHLQQYAVFFKVSMVDITTDYCGYYLLTETARPPQIKADIVIIHKQGRKTLYQYWFTRKYHKTNSPWQQQLTSDHNQLPEKGDRSLQKYNMEQKLTYISDKTSGQFTPHMLNLENLGAVSFTKGCYTGQEIIARTHYKGKNKKCTYLLTCYTNRQLAIMDNIYNADAQPCGVITSLYQEKQEEKGQHETAQHYLVLAVINHAMLQDNRCYLEQTLTNQLKIID